MNAKRYLDSIGSKYKRVFIIYSSTGATEPVFTEKTLATLGGRMDVVARTAFYALHDVKPCRPDTLFIAHLEGPPSPPRQVYIDCNSSAKMPVGERDMGRLLRILLETQESRSAFTGLVDLLRRKTAVYTLHESGEDIARVLKRPSLPAAFILGDQKGFPRIYEDHLLRYTTPISIGPRPYLASHVAAFVNEWLDSSLRLLSSE